MEECKDFERREGEPNLWYDRLVRFMEMGAKRSLDGCYRDLMNADRAAKGRERLHKGARCPAAWCKRAKEFDWWERAESYDEELRKVSLKEKKEALRLTRSYSVEAVKRMVDLMRGELKGPDGELVPGQDAVQTRLAMNSLLDRAGVVYEGLMGDEEDEDIQVVGITIHKSGKRQGEDDEEER